MFAGSAAQQRHEPERAKEVSSMPWKEVLSMDQKTQFVSEYLRGTISFS
jgi:hypothetical protein